MLTLTKVANSALTNYATPRTIVPRFVVPVTTLQKNILRYEREVGKLPQVDLPLRHFFIKSPRTVSGGYAREITMLKGTAAVGRVHKYPCINIISKGELVVATDNGVIHIKAPYTFVSEAGAKRALYMYEDTIWTTFHLTDETDISKIKDDLGVVTYSEYLSYKYELEKP